MNYTHIEKTGNASKPSTRLPSPHFDDSAVAVAQPVQPLPPPRKKRLLRTSLFFIAYLTFIVIVAAVALFAPPNSREDTEAATNETQSNPESEAVNSSAAPVRENASIATPVIRRARPHTRRFARLRFQNQTIQIVEGAEGKPLARKVGEIRYGRSSDRP